MRASHMAIIVASAPPFFTAVSTVSTLIASDYSSLSDTMSMLAGPSIPHPWVFQCGVVGYALLIQCLGPLLYRQAGRGWHGASLWTLILLYRNCPYQADISHIKPGVSKNPNACR